MNDPVETAELLAFTQTVDAASVSRAAAELGVPRATISRRLARLEERLGARLLRRTTRRLALTDAGDAFYTHARIVLDAISHAEASVRRTDQEVRGALRVSVPPLMSPPFSRMICQFAKTYPEVRLQVHFSTAHVDLLGGGYDLAIRASATLEPGLVARVLAKTRIIAVASPEYLATYKVPKNRRDLRHHRCLMGFSRGELAGTHWPYQGAQLHLEGSFFSNEVSMLRDAALEGLGIALLPELLIAEHLKSRRLVQVLAGAVEAESKIAAVYAEREFIPPAVRAFVDAVVAWAPVGLVPGVDNI